MNNALPDWLIICMWRALIGEIYPSIRAIAVALSESKTLLIRYYLDRVPTELDRESMEVIATNITASIPLDQIAHIDIDCQYTREPISELDCLDGFIYARREYDL